MGFVRKITGQQSMIDQAKKQNALQQQALAEDAKRQQEELMQTARAAADQQAMLAARSVAQDKAVDAASKPLAAADVQLVDDSPDTVGAGRAKRRAAYGRNYNSGVSI